MTTTATNLDPKSPVRVVYDTANSIIGADADHSPTIPAPRFIQFEALAVGTTLQLQQRIHVSASWVNVGTAYTSTDGAVVLSFAVVPNYARLVRTGAGAIVAYSQS